MLKQTIQLALLAGLTMMLQAPGVGGAAVGGAAVGAAAGMPFLPALAVAFGSMLALNFMLDLLVPDFSIFNGTFGGGGGHRYYRAAPTGGADVVNHYIRPAYNPPIIPNQTPNGRHVVDHYIRPAGNPPIIPQQQYQQQQNRAANVPVFRSPPAIPRVTRIPKTPTGPVVGGGPTEVRRYIRPV